MESWQIAIVAIAAFMILATVLSAALEVGKIRRDVARLDRKVNLLLKQMNVSYEAAFELSDRVKELARDPARKIAAIKAYREETGAGLYDTKEAVEAWISSSQR
jgi:ribosomal protein L7/L12